jgi:hypothetical protein
MKPRKIALALLPAASGRVRFVRVVVTAIFHGLDCAECRELTDRGDVRHVLPFGRIVSADHKTLLPTLRAKRAALALTLSRAGQGSPAVLQKMATAAA